MFINRSSSSKLINFPAKARSHIAPFKRVPGDGEKEQSFRDRETKHFWGELLRAIGDWLTSGDRPYIQEKRDRLGNLYFKVYEPCDRSSHVFESENEVRTWLERRYNY